MYSVEPNLRYETLRFVKTNVFKCVCVCVSLNKKNSLVQAVVWLQGQKCWQ